MPGAASEPSPSGGSSKPTSPVLERNSSAPTLATACPEGGGSGGLAGSAASAPGATASAGAAEAAPPSSTAASAASAAGAAVSSLHAPTVASSPLSTIDRLHPLMACDSTPF